MTRFLCIFGFHEYLGEIEYEDDYHPSDPLFNVKPYCVHCGHRQWRIGSVYLWTLPIGLLGWAIFGYYIWWRNFL